MLVFADEAVGVDDFAAAAARVFAGAVGVSRREGSGLEADAVVYLVEENNKGRRLVELLISHAAHCYMAFRIHCHINSRAPRWNVILRKFLPIRSHHNAILFHICKPMSSGHLHGEMPSVNK